MSNIPQKKVLIAPLDWGLGHATRCVPIVYQQIAKGNKVVIAADGNGFELLGQEFPEVEIIRLKGYNIWYSYKLGMTLSILLQVPKILVSIIREHQQLKSIVKRHRIDIVISDNRFGLWHSKVKSIFITHQIMIKMPNMLKFLEKLVYQINKLFINKYHECWVPDHEDISQSLSGDLSHLYPLPSNAKFIGPLSRFANSQHDDVKQDIDLLIILSGPEPMRSQFEDILLKQLQEFQGAVCLVRGSSLKLETRNSKLKTNIKIFNLVSAKDLEILIKRSKKVVSRSGYSTIMDLVTLNKSAILVPTPGQTEQEYLAKHLSDHPNFEYFEQKSCSLKQVLK